MTVVPDPVAQGFVASLARPGGNITGLTNLVPGLSQKYVQLLKEILPSASRFAVISSPSNPVPANRRELEAAVKALGMSVSFLPVHGPEDFEPALIRAKKEGGATGIIATSDPVTSLHSRMLVRLALQHRLAGIYWTREYVEHGGLMTYSATDRPVCPITPRSMWTRSAKAPSRPTSPSSSRRSSSWSSTSRPRRPSASRSRRLCCYGPIRSSNDRDHLRPRVRARPRRVGPGR